MSAGKNKMRLFSGTKEKTWSGELDSLASESHDMDADHVWGSPCMTGQPVDATTPGLERMWLPNIQTGKATPDYCLIIVRLVDCPAREG